MCKKLIFTAQEVIAGRFDGDIDKVSDFVEKRYKPSAVKLERYNPERDPNACIVFADLDSCGIEEKIVCRLYRRDGVTGLPLDAMQIIINGEAYFSLYGETFQPKIFIVDIDNSDQYKEFALVFTQERNYSFIRIFRYDNRSVREFGGIWGKLDNDFAGQGKIAEFPGDGSIITYIPGDDGFNREVIYLE